MCSGHHPDCVSSDDVGHIVRENGEVHSSIAFRPQSRGLGESGDPVRDRSCLVTETRSQPAFSRLAIGHVLGQLPLRLRRNEQRDFPSWRSISRSTSAKGRPSARPASISWGRRSISSSLAALAPTSPAHSRFSRRLRANRHGSCCGSAMASSGRSVKPRFPSPTYAPRRHRAADVERASDLDRSGWAGRVKRPVRDEQLTPLGRARELRWTPEYGHSESGISYLTAECGRVVFHQ